MSDNPNEEGELKTRGLLDGMVRLGYRVVNVGERDLILGFDEFQRRTAGLPLSFVSINIVKQGSTDPVFKPYTVLDVPGPGGKPVRVGVFGAVRFNPVWQKAGPGGENMAIVSPLDAAKRYVPELRQKSDVVVFLAALSKDDSQRIAQEVPGIDFVLGAYGGIYNTLDETVGETHVIYTGNQGKRIGETRIFVGEDRRVRQSVSFLHFLTSRYPDDPAMTGYVNDVLTKVAKLKGEPLPGAAGAPGAPHAAGGH